MEPYRITSSSEKGNDKARFLINKSIGPKKSMYFENVDQAKGSPLIQQLFYLPFVKAVKIEEKQIEVTRFDILEWEDVIDEVSAQLQNYLNDGGEVFEKKLLDKTPVTIYAESTPNPSVMKFVSNKKLTNETVEFKNIDDAKGSPLAKKLFHFPFVKEIFISSNYVSISKYDISTWEEVVMELREFIRSFIEEGNVIIEKSKVKRKNQKLSSLKNLNSLEEKIVSILEEYIKPAVASDGGNIEFDSYDKKEKSVQVVLQGACSGCPSSTFTLKNGIENMLKEMLPGKVESVIAING